MANLTPVDNDPFAQGGLDDVAQDSMRREVAADPKLTAVDHNPFAARPEPNDAKPAPDWLFPLGAPDWAKKGAGAFIQDAKNLPGDTWDAAKALGGRVLHDVQVPGDAVEDAKAIGKSVVDTVKDPGKLIQYGAEHPANALLNALTMGTMGEFTAGRAALKGTTKTAAGADAALVRPVNSLLSGVSGDAQKLAQSAGEEGGAKGRAFRTNMAEPDYEGMQRTGQLGVSDMKQARGSAYDTGMQDTRNSPARVRYTNTLDASQSARRDFGLGQNGQFVKNPGVMDALNDVDSAIAGHRAVAGQPHIRASARSPLEMDELKQRINQIWRELPEGSPQAAAVGRVREALGNDIVKAVPTYADVMEGYGGASDSISSAIKDLGLGKRATRGTAAGKLMSAMRDTGSAAQVTKADALASVAKHQPTLPYQIAGASMNPVLPRGIVARGGALLHGLEGAGVGGLLAHFLHPGTLGPLLASSPRVVGNVRYGLGATTRGARKVGLTQKNAGLAADAARVSSIWDDQ